MPPKSRFPDTLRATAMRGVTVLFAASLTAKLAAIASIYVTGRVLSKTDFALYAIAIAWSEIFGYLQNGGLHRLLLQRARSFDNLYAPVLGMSLAINGILFLVLLALAPFIADTYEAKEVKALIAVYGFSILVGTMAPLLRTYLMVNLRFAELSVLDVYSALIRYGGIILFAINGFGPMSFVLPIIAVGVFEAIYLSRSRLASWRPTLPRPRLLVAVARPLLWIFVGTVAVSLATNGDYLVIGALEDKVIVGVYFFGFRLTVAVLSLFTRSLRLVVVPSLVTIGGDQPRQERAFLRSLELGSLLLFFIVFAIAAVAEPVIGWVWSGKWDAAIQVVEIIAIASLARVVAPMARYLLEARGAWRTIALMSWVQGLSLMTSAALGAFIGGLFEIAMSVGVNMTLVGILYIFVICRHTRLPIVTVAKSVLGPYTIAGLALATAWALAAAFEPHANAFLETLVKGTGYAVIFGLLVALFRRDLMYTALDFVWKWSSR